MAVILKFFICNVNIFLLLHELHQKILFYRVKIGKMNWFDNKESLELNGSHQELIHSDGANLLDENISIIKMQHIC
jgi:hypothetical protein